jgi:flavodoxin I
MTMSVGIFFGSTTGNTEDAAKRIKARLGDCVAALEDVADADPATLEKYDLLLLGVPTWDVGDLQSDWGEFVPKMEGLDLSGKKVALFGLGDALGYPDNFLDAMGELWGAVRDLGEPELVGTWPTEGYEFNASAGLYDDDHFIGLALDEDNESGQTGKRIAAWLEQVKEEAGLMD